MANKDVSRRHYLRAGAAALTAGLAGCNSGIGPLPKRNPNPPRSPRDSNETNEDETPYSNDLPSGPAAQFKSNPEHGTQFTFSYEDLTEFNQRELEWAKNGSHPDSSIIDVTVEDATLTATIENVAVFRDLDIELWTARNTDEGSQYSTTTLAGNNEDATDPSFHTETIELDAPSLEPHITTVYTLAIIDHATSPDWDEGPGRLLKTERAIPIPYDTPNGRDTRILGGTNINYRVYKTERTPPNYHNESFTEELNDGSRVVFFIIEASDNRDYGVATRIPASAASNQNYHTDRYGDLMIETSNADQWPHIQTLATEIRSANQKLDNWDTLETQLNAVSDFFAHLPYESSGGQYTHPTASLLTGSHNCTEKTLLFNAIIQTDVFGFDGEDAAYVGCTYNGQAHLIAGINVDKIEGESDWTVCEYPDVYINKFGAPDDQQYYPIEMTSTDPLGHISDNAYSSIYPRSNLDGDYLDYA